MIWKLSFNFFEIPEIVDSRRVYAGSIDASPWEG